MIATFSKRNFERLVNMYPKASVNETYEWLEEHGYTGSLLVLFNSNFIDGTIVGYRKDASPIEESEYYEGLKLEELKFKLKATNA